LKDIRRWGRKVVGLATTDMSRGEAADEKGMKLDES
jgi:hypothetical protein